MTNLDDKLREILNAVDRSCLEVDDISDKVAIAQIKQAFADEHEEAELRVIKRMGWPYEHAVAFPELRKELGMCLHEDYAFNGGKCSQCGKVFPGEWI